MTVTYLGAFGATSAEAVTSTSGSWSNPGPFTHVMVRANRNIHFSNQGAATANDFYAAAFEAVRIQLDVSEALHFIVDTSETDGTIWLTGCE